MKSPWKRSLLVLTMMLGLTPAGEAAVWETQNHWSPQWEQRFGQFIARLDLSLFINKGGRWSGIPTDCADAAYTLRTIFAFENKLPVLYQTWKGPYTNEMTEFDNISDPIARVRTFISRVNAFTSTTTLVNDTYPIAIRRESLVPGTLFLHPQGSNQVPLTYRAGHVYYIQNVGDNGIIRYVSSTVPTRVRALDARNGIQFAPMTTEGGYRAWIWPDTPQRLFLSSEQFNMGGWQPKSYRNYEVWTNWQNAIQARLRTRFPTPTEQLNAQLENLTTLVNNRAVAVLEGWRVYRQKYAPGQCMSENDYSNYSTPTRDVKLQVELQDFEDAAEAYAQSRHINVQSLYQRIRFRVLPGVEIDVTDLQHAFLTDVTLAISEPEHAPEVRWGLETQAQWPCPHRSKAYVGGDRIRHE